MTRNIEINNKKAIILKYTNKNNIDSFVRSKILWYLFNIQGILRFF